MTNAEALFFVDDQQAEILELELLSEDRVRADEDVNLAGLSLLDDGCLLLRGPEA